MIARAPARSTLPREHRLAARAADLLARVREWVGPVRAPRRGHGAETWDKPIREALAQRPTADADVERWREACAAWEEAELVWWQLAQHRTADVIRAEARTLLPRVRGRFGLEDLIQAGYLGAYRAAQGWDPSEAASWRTYVSNGIRQHIQIEVRRGAHEYVKVAGGARLQLWRLRRIQAELQRESIELPRSALVQLAEIPQTLATALLSSGNVVHIDDRSPLRGQSKGDGSDYDRHEAIGGDTPVDEWDDAIDLDWARERLTEAMTELDKRERLIIEGRMAGETLAQLGERLKVSKEWVRRLEARALWVLSQALGVEIPPTIFSKPGPKDSGRRA